jgi:NAD-dependent SIR2 family protein deacetylase
MKSKDKPTICEYCGFKSCTKVGFYIHMKKVHDIKLKRKKHGHKLECPKCDQKFYSRVNLRSHEKTKQELQKCEDCGFKSCTYVGFFSHLRKMHGKEYEKSNIKDDHSSNFGKLRIFNCIKCDQKFYSRANLEFHVKKIRDEVMSCSKCDFNSCTKTGLLIHLRNVHDIRSDAVENVSDGAMILDVSEHKQSIPMTSHGRFMVS